MGWLVEVLSVFVFRTSVRSLSADVVVKCPSVQLRPWSAWGRRGHAGSEETEECKREHRVMQSAVPCKPPSRDVTRGWWWQEGASCVLACWGLLVKISSILWRCWLVVTLRVMISEMWCNKNQMLCSHNLKLTLISLYFIMQVSRF